MLLGYGVFYSIQDVTPFEILCKKWLNYSLKLIELTSPHIFSYTTPFVISNRHLYNYLYWMKPMVEFTGVKTTMASMPANPPNFT